MLNESLSYELTVSAIEKFSQIAVYNLQASDYVHCQEEIYESKRFSKHLYIYFLIITVAFFIIFLESKKKLTKIRVHYN